MTGDEWFKPSRYLTKFPDPVIDPTLPDGVVEMKNKHGSVRMDVITDIPRSLSLLLSGERTQSPLVLASRLIDMGESDLALMVLRVADHKCPRHPHSRTGVAMTDRLLSFCIECNAGNPGVTG